MNPYEIIKAHFEKQDIDLIKTEGSRVFDTSHGIFGVSDLQDLREFFEKINLSEKKGFVDLGSGDGRVVLLASVFTKSLGIEADKKLHERAIKNKKAVQEFLEDVKKCRLVCANYTDYDLSDYDVIFTYIDHKWPKKLEDNLLKNWKGTVYCYRNIFPPEHLRKGPTLWIGQTPIVSYDVP